MSFCIFSGGSPSRRGGGFAYVRLSKRQNPNLPAAIAQNNSQQQQEQTQSTAVSATAYEQRMAALATTKKLQEISQTHPPRAPPTEHLMPTLTISADGAAADPQPPTWRVLALCIVIIAVGVVQDVVGPARAHGHAGVPGRLRHHVQDEVHVAHADHEQRHRERVHFLHPAPLLQAGTGAGSKVGWCTVVCEV